MEVLAKKHELLHPQIAAWKTEVIKNISLVFNQEKAVAKKRRNPDREIMYQNWKVKTGE